MNKVERDGKVAVIVSPSFGAGWFTWNYECGSELLFSPELIRLIESKADPKELEQAAERLFPKAYLGGLCGAVVEWLPKGTLFRIHEYDGAESIEICDEIEWQTA